MTTLADLVSLTVDPATGREVLRIRSYGYQLLGAAALYDLVDRGRLGRTGDERRTRVALLDSSPVPEASLEHCLARVRKHSTQRPHNAVLRLGGGTSIRAGVYGGLAGEGVIAPDPSAPPGAHVHRVLQPERRAQLIGRVHDTLLGGSPPDEPTRRLAVLLGLGDGRRGPLLDIVLDRGRDGGPLEGRMREAARQHAVHAAVTMATPDWIALAVRRVVGTHA